MTTSSSGFNTRSVSVVDARFERRRIDGYNHLEGTLDEEGTFRLYLYNDFTNTHWAP